MKIICYRNARLSFLILAAVVNPLFAQQATAPATYNLLLTAPEATRVFIRATMPSNGDLLAMATSRPGDIPEVADAGWPALVRNLQVTDVHGTALEVTSAGAEGWRLAHPVRGELRVSYEVEFAPLAARGWPAPREAAFADGDHLVLIGRSLFITTPLQQSSVVDIVAPAGWQAVTPWAMSDSKPGSANVASTADLQENLVVLMSGAPGLVTAGGFNLKVVSLGHWRSARAEVQDVLGSAVAQLVALMGFRGDADYMVVLLPQKERGGESFRGSFAMNFDADPSRASRGDWANTITHEIMHYWNGWRLKGADYASSQWFGEGFTEYAANLALVRAGLVTPEEFYLRLALHVTRYRRLATPLDAPGTRKGQPLYSGGALVAFAWDGMIREATQGRRGVADIFPVLMRTTNGGARAYEWSDIQSALETVASADWADYRRRYIHGTEPLPLEDAFRRIGLKMNQGADGVVSVAADPAAQPSAVAVRASMVGETLSHRHTTSPSSLSSGMKAPTSVTKEQP